MKADSFAGRVLRSIPPLMILLSTCVAGVLFFRSVDLKPHVESNFFFSEEDPAFRRDLEIKRQFPEPEQVILAVRGPIHSETYRNKIDRLSTDLLGMPAFFAVQSLTMGPRSTDDALKGPLWSRMILSRDTESSLILLFCHEVPDESVFRQIEQIAAFYEGPDFKINISGAPYIIDLIRLQLFQDLKTFSLAALLIFSLVMLGIFRSFRILFGTLVACSLASMTTLWVSNWIQIGIGPLTANLSTIVFVLTLSHIAYITFNWKHALEHADKLPRHPVLEALRVTIQPSFWSMLTTFLGFVTLNFVEAAPFRNLGVSGSIGTLIALLTAYAVFPWFLGWVSSHPRRHRKLPDARPKMRMIREFLAERHPVLVTLIFAGAIGMIFGIPRMNRDPHLLSYFQPDTPLRQGLDEIDRQWGSSSLKIVIRDESNRPFTDSEVQKKLWDLQRRLESYDQIGNVASLPLIVDEARRRVWYSSFVSNERVLEELSKPVYGEITQQFVTQDRRSSLILVRMKTLARQGERDDIINRVQTIIWSQGFRTELTGGLYLLQGEMAKVVLSSLLTGLAMLLLLFFIMGIFLTGSLHIAGAMFASLVIIPVWLLGMLGYLQIPLDMISAPAANLAIAMGVDAMIHMLLMVKRCHHENESAWDAWVEARMRLWKPVLTSTALVCTGFVIFLLSYFPPTQRFGASVVTGSLIAASSALLILPTLAGTSGRLRSRWVRQAGRESLSPSAHDIQLSGELAPDDSNHPAS